MKFDAYAVAHESEELILADRLRRMEDATSLMIIERIWAMPNANTFSIPPIAKLLKEEVGSGFWVDPFARNSAWATVTNDINPDTSAQFHLDAVEFLQKFETSSVDGVLFDPPYSPRQIKEVYDAIGIPLTMETTQARFWARVKDEIARVVKPGGKVISCAWNSMGIGQSRGFTITRILLVPHGGWHNDTIVTVEVKQHE